MGKKHYRLVWIFVFSLVILSISAIDTKALSTEGFICADKTKEEQAAVWERIDLQPLNDAELSAQGTSAIISFDVSKSGRIAVVFTDARILIMDPNGAVLQGFRFEASGSFSICWNEDNLQLFLVRSNLVIEFSQAGQLIKMIEIPVSDEKSNALWTTDIYRTMYRNDERFYELQKGTVYDKLILHSYSRLICNNGEETILFDVSRVRNIQISAFIIIGVVVFGLIIAVVIANNRSQNIAEDDAIREERV